MSTRTLPRPAAAPGYVAIYARISEDPSGKKMGVKTQLAKGHAYAAQHWPGVPVVLFADNDLSASRDDVVRPEWERLRAAIRAGEVAHVWAIEQSRFTRKELEWFAFSTDLAAAGVTEVHTDRDGILRVGDEIAGIKAVLSAAETRRLSRRVRDRMEANAAAGLPPGGRHFGYRAAINERGQKTYEIVEEEAAIIRESAQRVLAGWSLSSIIRDLRARGVVGPHRVYLRNPDGSYVTEDGRPVEEGGVKVWRPSRLGYSSVRSWLTSPTVAAKRVHQGEIIADGNWPPILDEDTWRAVRQVLATDRIVTIHGGPDDGKTHAVRAVVGRGAGRHLLSGGVAVCGVCGKPLGAGADRRKGTYYRCATVYGGRGCVSIRASKLEPVVVDELHAKLANPKFAALVRQDLHSEDRDRLARAIAALDPQRADLARMWAKRQITADEWMEAKRGLAEEEVHLRRQLAELPEPTGDLDPEEIIRGWNRMTLDEQRHTIRRFVQRVVVHRVDRSLPMAGQDRVSIDWRPFAPAGRNGR